MKTMPIRHRLAVLAAFTSLALLRAQAAPEPPPVPGVTPVPVETSAPADIAAADLAKTQRALAAESAAIQRQVKDAQKQAHARQAAAADRLDSVRREIELARAEVGMEDPPEPPEAPEPPEPPEMEGFNVDIHADQFGNLGEGRRSTPPLIVESGDIKPERQTQLSEDLTVMHRILAKAAEMAGGQPGANTAMGIAVWSPFSQSGARSIYLEGYGAVFLLNVGFPLVGPPAGAATQEDQGESKDTTWEETKRELYGAKPGGESSHTRPTMSAELMKRYGLLPPGFNYSEKPVAKAVPYNAARVDALKDALIEALKNAANIRQLPANEQLVVVVQGGRRVTRVITKEEMNAKAKADGYTVNAVGFIADGPLTTTLTLQCRKSDAAAFADGKLSLAEFRQQIRLAVY